MKEPDGTIDNNCTHARYRGNARPRLGHYNIQICRLMAGEGESYWMDHCRCGVSYRMTCAEGGVFIIEASLPRPSGHVRSWISIQPLGHLQAPHESTPMFIP